MKKCLLGLMCGLGAIFIGGCATNSGVVVYSEPVVIAVPDYWPTYYYCHPWWGYGYWHHPYNNWRSVPRPHFHNGPMVPPPPHYRVEPPHGSSVPHARPPGPPAMRPGQSYHNPQSR